MRIILMLALVSWALAVPVPPAEAGTFQSKSDGLYPGPRPPSRWWTIEKIKQELKLTAEQSAEIEQIVQQSMARLKGDKEDLDRAQSDFRQLMERPNVSERELLKVAERLEMARYSISKERTTMLVRIHIVLTPEQRRGLDAIAKRHEAEHHSK
ncbi:MAG TPA: Spy/CpxP family protein refolding chaperone [Vicinamibacterales bacterium]|nr:Spy/CpxP family protein refolding chaperone [Vicinamibacterales bacterium]